MKIRPGATLAFQDGKYGPGKPAVDFLKHRVDWIYEFTFATVDNAVLRKQRDDARASYARCRGDSE